MIVRILKYLTGILFGIILILLVVFFSSPLWRHWVTYPRLDHQIAEFQKKEKRATANFQPEDFSGSSSRAQLPVT